MTSESLGMSSVPELQVIKIILHFTVQRWRWFQRIVFLVKCLLVKSLFDQLSVGKMSFQSIVIWPSSVAPLRQAKPMGCRGKKVTKKF